MNEQEAKKRIDELVKLLNYHSQLYYVEDRNEITDYEYDMLQQELKGLEEQFPQFIRSDSPTQRVGGKAISIFEKVTHRVQMGSLQDVFSFEQVTSFRKTFLGIYVSPLTSIKGSSSFIFIGMDFTVFRLEVTSSPTKPSPRVEPMASSPL